MDSAATVLEKTDNGQYCINGVELISERELLQIGRQSDAVIFVCDTGQFLEISLSPAIGVGVSDVWCGDFLPNDKEEFVSSLGNCRVSDDNGKITAEYQNYIYNGPEIEKLYARIYETRDKVFMAIFPHKEFFLSKPPYGKKKILLFGNFSTMERPKETMAAMEAIMKKIAGSPEITWAELRTG